MNQNEIEKLLARGQYADALKELKISKPSPWTDTYQLKCLRALGNGKQAMEMADTLYDSLKNRLSGYEINSSERNNQLRHIALIYAENNKTQKAARILRVLCQKKPDYPSLRREYAFALICNEQLDKAEVQLSLAIAMDPVNADSHARLGGLQCRLGQVDTGYNSYLRAASLEPDNETYAQRLVYWNNYSERSTQQSNFHLAKLWAKRFYQDQRTPMPLLDGKPRNHNPDRRLRVGFVSANFFSSSSQVLVAPVLKNLDQESFTLFAYNDSRNLDQAHNSLPSACEYWEDSHMLNDAQLVELIQEDQIDILVDLGGHSAGNRLGVFAARAAPVQVSWLAYPATSGLQNMDFRLTDHVVDPVGLNEQYFCEELVRLRNGFLCYEPNETASDIAADYDDEIIRFGSFNSLAKISTLTLDAWTAAMHVVPNSHLYLRRSEFQNQVALRHFTEKFVSRGIDPARVHFEVGEDSDDNHLARYNSVDIALDTSPFNGVSSALDALWMGVPVITLKCNTHASRITASLLERIHLSGLACTTISEFCHRVKELSDDLSARQDLRKNLRSTMRKSALMNTNQFADEFGRALRWMWQDWCENPHEQSIDSLSTINLQADQASAQELGSAAK